MPYAEPGPLAQEVAALIRARMARFNVSGVDLAKSVGVSQSQLSKITRGVKDIDVDLLEQVCWALDMDIEKVIAEAVEVVSGTGWVPQVGETFVEMGARVMKRQPATDVGDGRDTVQIDELTLAADTQNQSPDEDRLTP